jgi:hypothetical protein
VTCGGDIRGSDVELLGMTHSSWYAYIWGVRHGYCIILRSFCAPAYDRLRVRHSYRIIFISFCAPAYDRLRVRHSYCTILISFCVTALDWLGQAGSETGLSP